MLAKKYQILNFLGNIDTEKKVNRDRIQKLNNIPIKSGVIIYVMQRESRYKDNDALLFAQELALEISAPILVINFSDINEGISSRQFDFCKEGLIDLKNGLDAYNIGFFNLVSNKNDLVDIVKRLDAGAVITDFSPLIEANKTINYLCKNLDYPIFEVDGHNVLPAKIISDKQEYSAASFRVKVNRNITHYLNEYKNLIVHPFDFKPDIDFDFYSQKSPTIIKTPSISKIKGGSHNAQATLQYFIEQNLCQYDEYRNFPQKESTSGLSPFLHFGHIAPRRVALEIIKANSLKINKEAFLEELIVRQELADNFCLYANSYKDFSSIPNWAALSLNKHKDDFRPYIYKQNEFEEAKTHETLWNNIQKSLLSEGKIHPYLRMYWAKKILEWSKTPQDALETAIYLNDKYSLDGKDSNGYTGILWSIGGLHDRPWQERDIFGKIRFMSGERLKQKLAL
ncbi:MAG: deoxyribodipyrimidine photo-lyase [Candidatus Gastranaerophilales bacterium]|nr:deoxyribodipyrimidine photo-lyase [Candidatus Gastranaerophilales bacterium]